MPMTSDDLGSAIQDLFSAISSGNTQKAQEAIHQWNLTYTNQVAEQYGQNFGVGQPAPPGAPTLAAGQATGSIGYIPGYTGVNAGQTSAELAGLTSAAQAGAGLTGFYAAPSQSQYTPGTFVRLDPSTYDTNQYGGTQISYVLPSGQLQRVSIPQAQAMGWNGNLSTMAMLPAQQALMLERAPPQQLPQQTLQGLTSYSNLNTAAMNQAVAQAGQTGMYQAPAQILPPGTNAGGGKFSDLDPQTQQNYYLSRGSDWNAAMAAWVADSNNAMRQAGGGGQLPNQQGAPQLTLAAQQQTYAQQMGMIKQAADLQANPFRQQQAIGQMSGLLGGQGVAGFQAPNYVQGVGAVGMGGATAMPGQMNGGPVPGNAQWDGQQGWGQGWRQGEQQGASGDINAQGQFVANPAMAQRQPGQPPMPAQQQQYGGGYQGTGMGYLQQMIDDIQSPGANQTSMQNVLNAIPTPNKLNSNEFLRSAPSTQSMVLQGMQEKYGLDPKDALAQIQNTLPQFKAPTTMGAVKR